MSYVLTFVIRVRRDGMPVGFTTSYAINVYYHWHCEFDSVYCELCLLQHYVIEFVS